MFKKNDVVCVVGSTVEQNGAFYEFKIGKVIEVALHDLIVEPETGFWKSHIRVSKESCILLNPTKTIPEAVPVLPEIGDLVMNYQHSYKSDPVKEIGLLVSIKYSPGEPTSGKVIVSGKQKSYDLKDFSVSSFFFQRRPSHLPSQF